VTWRRPLPSALADLAQGVLAGAGNQLLLTDPREDLLLVANVIERLRVVPGQLTDLRSDTLTGRRQRVVDRVLPGTELDQQIAVQVNPLLHCRRPLQALDELKGTRAQVLIERLVKDLLLGGDLTLVRDRHAAKVTA
jgi:hypothetical protein